MKRVVERRIDKLRTALLDDLQRGILKEADVIREDDLALSFYGYIGPRLRMRNRQAADHLGLLFQEGIHKRIPNGSVSEFGSDHRTID
jgi:hypothetical protein